MDELNTYFRPFSWSTHQPDDGQYEVRAWCHNKNSEPSLVRIRGYLPFIHFQLPNVVNGRPYKWSAQSARLLIEELNEFLKTKSKWNPIQIKAYKYVDARSWYYFDPAETFSSFVRLSFKNERQAKSFAWMCKNPFDLTSFRGIDISDCDSFIPFHYKLLAVKNCQTTGWIDAGKGRLASPYEKCSTCRREIVVDWMDMEPVPKEICAFWFTRCKIGVYDDENFSDRFTRLPDPYLASNCVFMSSVIIKTWGLPETEKAYLLFLGDLPDCPEYNIICRKTEIELINETFKIMADEDVDIYAGYNVFGWDNRFRNTRYSRRNLKWPAFSRIIGEQPEFIEISWESSAYGKQHICYPNAQGRICLDALYYIKRDYKFEEYGLGAVGRELVGETKDDVSPVYMFTWFAEYQIAEQLKEADPARFERAQAAMKKIADYCVQDSRLTLKIIEKLNIWLSIMETASIMCVQPFELYSRGQQLRIISQLFIRCLKSRIIMRVRKSPELPFTGAVVNDSEQDIYDLVIGLDFKSLYPSIIMAYNISHETLVPREHWNDPRLVGKTHRIAWKESEFGDKFRFERNYSGGDDAPFEEDGYASDDGEAKDTPSKANKDAEYEFRWRIAEEVDEVQSDGTTKKVWKYKGELPKLEEEMLVERNRLKKLMKGKNEDSLEYQVLDVGQNGCKITMNSGYGSLGAPTGKASLIEGAMCVTAIGRRSILMVNDDVEACGAAYIVDYIPQYEVLRGIKMMEQYLVNITMLVAKRISGDPEKARAFFMKYVPEKSFMVDIFDIEDVANEIYNILHPMVVEFSKMPIKGSTPEETTLLKNAKKEKAKELLPNICKAVYNDTDSSLVTFFTIKDPAFVYLFGGYLAKRISEMFPPPMEIDFEKVYYVLAVIKKKKYQGILLTGKTEYDDPQNPGQKLIDWNESFKPKVDESIFLSDFSIDYEKAKKGITKKGVATARRDWTKLLQKIFWLLTAIGLLRRPIRQALDAIQDAVFAVMQRRVPFSEIPHILLEKVGEGNQYRPIYKGGIWTEKSVEWNGDEYVEVEKVGTPKKGYPVMQKIKVMEMVDGVEHEVMKTVPVLVEKLVKKVQKRPVVEWYQDVDGSYKQMTSMKGFVVEEKVMIQKMETIKVEKLDEEDIDVPIDELSPFIYLLTNTKGYSGKYAENSNSPMKIFAERSAAAGKPFMPGERIRYLITTNFDQFGNPIMEEAQGNKYRTPAQYLIDAREGKCKVDLRYYIEKQMTNSLEQLLNTCYKGQLDQTKLPDRILRRINLGSVVLKQFIELPTKPRSHFVNQLLRLIDAKSYYLQEISYFNKCEGYPYSYLRWKRQVIDTNRRRRGLKTFEPGYAPYVKEDVITL